MKFQKHGVGFFQKTLVTLCAISLAPLLSNCNKKAEEKAETSDSIDNLLPTSSPTPGGSSSGGGSSGGPVVISGTLSIAAASAVNTATVFNVGGTSLSASSDQPTTPVVAGALSVSTGESSGAHLLEDSGDGGSEGQGDKDGSNGSSNAVVMVMNQTGTNLLDAFESMKFIGAPVAGGEQLLSFATGKAKSDEIALGQIGGTGEDLISEKTLGSAQFDLPEDKLTEVAKLDDAMRVLKNKYANSSDKGSMMGVQEFYWDARILNEAINAETNAAAITFTGWSPALHIDRSDISFSDICTAAKNFVFEIPAPGVKRELTDTSYLTQITNNSPTMNPDGNSCGAGAGISNFFGKRDNAQSKNLYMNFGGGEPFKTPIPTGTWKIKLNNETVAKFDLAVSYPLIPDVSDSTKLVPRVYIPALKLTTNPTTHIVEKVEVRLYLWNKVDKNFQLVSNYDTFKSVVESVWFSLSGKQNGANVDEYMNNTDSYAAPVNEKPVRTMIPDPKWRFQASDDADCVSPTGYVRLEQVNVQMIMYGNRYSFNFMVKKNGCI